MEQLSKAQKVYFFLLMSGLDRAHSLYNGCFLAEEGLHTLTLYEYGIPGQVHGEQLLMFAHEEDIDEFKLLDPTFLVIGLDGFIPSPDRSTYTPTLEGCKLYLQLVDELILDHVKTFWLMRPDAADGRESICHNKVVFFNGETIAIPPTTFEHRVRALISNNKLAEYPRPAREGCHRLYIPDNSTVDATPEGTPGTIRDQYNSGHDHFSGNQNVTINYHNGSGSGPDYSNKEPK